MVTSLISNIDRFADTFYFTLLNGKTSAASNLRWNIKPSVHYLGGIRNERTEKAWENAVQG